MQINMHLLIIECERRQAVHVGRFVEGLPRISVQRSFRAYEKARPHSRPLSFFDLKRRPPAAESSNKESFVVSLHGFETIVQQSSENLFFFFFLTRKPQHVGLDPPFGRCPAAAICVASTSSFDAAATSAQSSPPFPLGTFVFVDSLADVEGSACMLSRRSAASCALRYGVTCRVRPAGQPPDPTTSIPFKGAVPILR